MSNLEFSFAAVGELERVSAFIRGENRETKTTASYLEWWYFRNPTGLQSLLFLQQEGQIIGFASLNNVKIVLAGKEKLAGMPQKVVTAAALRGRGLFGKLYWKTEEDSLAKGTDLFLTFTNAASTPIFLEKFSYRRGVCPDLVVLPAQILRVFSRPHYDVVEAVGRDFFTKQIYSPANSVLKCEQYLRWRYMSYETRQYEILEVYSQSQAVLGYAFLKRISRKGLPFYLLMDVVSHQRDELAFLVEQAALFATRRGALALLYLDFPEISAVHRRRFHRKVSNRFNFLVKGRYDEETKGLSVVPFAFSFGDFDFI